MKNARGGLAPGKLKLRGKEKYTRLFSAKHGTALSLRSGCVVLAKSDEIGEHSTEEREEVLIVLEGKGELILSKGKKIRFEKDFALYVPPRTAHNIRNIGTKDLKYVFITA